MPKNLTLRIDEDLIRAARHVALDRNTSVNDLVREYLEALVAESGNQHAALIQMEAFFPNKPFAMGRRTGRGRNCMSDDRVTRAAFVDTNILVYAIAGDDERRSPVAQGLLRELMLNRSLRTRIQVLQELFVTLIRKGKQPMQPQTGRSCWECGSSIRFSLRRAE